jgi:DNA-binding GntR family transcriptional regulator
MKYTTYQRSQPTIGSKKVVNMSVVSNGARTLLSATDLATEEIRDYIHSGKLEPGDRIRADELAEQLGISRTPVRDALQVLRTEGLVEILPRVGVFVRRITPSEIEEVYALKLAVEPLAASWAAQRGSTSAKVKLQGLLDGLHAAAEERDIRRAAETVDQIHNEIFTLAGSEVFSDVYRVFHARVKILRQFNMSQPGRLQISRHQHSEIVEAIVSGDGEWAAKTMTAHLMDAAASAHKTLPAKADLT